MIYAAAIIAWVALSVIAAWIGGPFCGFNNRPAHGKAVQPIRGRAA